MHYVRLGFWLYALVSTGWLIGWMTISGYSAWQRYEHELEMTKIWREHFKTEVASSWIFFDGVG